LGSLTTTGGSQFLIELVDPLAKVRVLFDEPRQLVLH
jgi:hypothetical protein